MVAYLKKVQEDLKRKGDIDKEIIQAKENLTKIDKLQNLTIEQLDNKMKIVKIKDKEIGLPKLQAAFTAFQKDERYQAKNRQ